MTDRPLPRPIVASRLAGLDIMRAFALLAMFVFHFSLDLSIVGLVDLGTLTDWRWITFARTIAGSFITIAGISLMLAYGHGIRWPSFWRRFLRIAGGAALVTLATWFTFPQAFVFFGILHHIALGSLLALPFLLAPTFVIALAAAACFALPFFVSAPIFNAGPLIWLGLGSGGFDSMDYVPVLPWFAFMLFGLIVARQGIPERLLDWRATGPIGRSLAFIGRHTLVIYLVHQPIFIAVLTAVAWVASPASPDADKARFVQDCVVSCGQTGTLPMTCRAACACTADAIEKAGDTAIFTSRSLTPDQSTRLSDFARDCTNEP